jgi:DGQHR domain-containing protein
MSAPTGDALEDLGREVLGRLGLRCYYDLNDTPLLELDPDGAYSSDDHLEVDYLIPVGDTCLVGEITGRADPSDVRHKHSNFKKHFNTLRSLDIDEEEWKSLGIPESDIGIFLKTKELKGFFITNRLQRFDVGFTETEPISVFYKNDWELLKSYSRTIGKWTENHFLSHFVTEGESNIVEDIKVSKGDNSLSRLNYRKVASRIDGFSNLYTFEISPYRIISYTQVYRKDNLPSSTEDELPNYQRPLIDGKLESIRSILKQNPNFVFPNSILCVLSERCEYKKDDGYLEIPKRYGSMAVIDGQHRLFSYADNEVKEKSTKPRVLITAVEFRNPDPVQINEYSARTFVEINTNQTKIDKNHLDIISYEILGETHPRALAAHVLLNANESDGSLYGLFDTYKTGLGIFRVSTVKTALKTITSISKISRLEGAQRGKKLRKKNGYEALLDRSISSLKDPEVLIEKGAHCLTRFFNNIRHHFENDWPRRGEEIGSSLEFAKVIAGLVKLLRHFINEGHNWGDVGNDIDSIKRNILDLRGIDNLQEEQLLLDPSDEDIPDADPSKTNDFRFFRSNISEPTSILTILEEN